MIKAKPKTKSKKLRQPREKRTGPPLQKIADELGVSPSTIFRWETSGIPGRGNAKAWREQALREVVRKLGEQGAA